MGEVTAKRGHLLRWGHLLPGIGMGHESHGISRPWDRNPWDSSPWDSKSQGQLGLGTDFARCPWDWDCKILLSHCFGTMWENLGQPSQLRKKHAVIRHKAVSISAWALPNFKDSFSFYLQKCADLLIFIDFIFYNMKFIYNDGFFLMGAKILHRTPPRRLEIATQTLLKYIVKEFGYLIGKVLKVMTNRKYPKNRK